jgi:hypothetical protein
MNIRNMLQLGAATMAVAAGLSVAFVARASGQGLCPGSPFPTIPNQCYQVSWGSNCTFDDGKSYAGSAQSSSTGDIWAYLGSGSFKCVEAFAPNLSGCQVYDNTNDGSTVEVVGGDCNSAHNTGYFYGAEQGF